MPQPTSLRLVGDHVPQPPAGAASVKCGCCGASWAIERTRASRAIDGWWLCPAGCRVRPGRHVGFNHPGGRRHP